MKKTTKIFGYILILAAFAFTIFNSYTIVQTASNLNYKGLKAQTALAGDCYDYLKVVRLRCKSGQVVIRCRPSNIQTDVCCASWQDLCPGQE